MSDLVKLGSRLPAGEFNGLDAIAEELRKDPHATRVLLLIVDCKEITTKLDTEDTVAALRIRRAEPLRGRQLTAAKKLYLQAMEQRTGRQALPIDEQEEIDAAFEAGN